MECFVNADPDAQCRRLKPRSAIRIGTSCAEVGTVGKGIDFRRSRLKHLCVSTEALVWVAGQHGQVFCGKPFCHGLSCNVHATGATGSLKLFSGGQINARAARSAKCLDY